MDVWMKNFRATLPVFILIISMGCILSIYGSSKVDLLYGRGEAQNTPLLQPYRQISNIWPDYSLQFGDDAIGVTGNSQVGISYLNVDSINIGGVDFGFLPRGTYLISMDTPLGNESKFNLFIDGRRAEKQPSINSLGDTYSFYMPFTSHVGGQIVMSPNQTTMPKTIVIRNMENRHAEFPETRITLILLILIGSLSVLFLRKFDENHD
jgi:hypothetical protein